MFLRNLTLAFILTASSAFALGGASIVGNYSGKGNWKMESATGVYSGTMNITQGVTDIFVEETMTIHTPDGQTVDETYSWTASQRTNGHFDITSNGKITGSGYCFDSRCHMQATSTNTAGGSYEETMVFSPKGVYRLGSETSAQGTVAWEGFFDKK